MKRKELAKTLIYDDFKLSKKTLVSIVYTNTPIYHRCTTEVVMVCEITKHINS